MVTFVHSNHHVKVTDRVFSTASASSQGGSVNALDAGNPSLKCFAIPQSNVEASPSPEP
jgi:hypothetical protein